MLVLKIVIALLSLVQLSHGARKKVNTLSLRVNGVQERLHPLKCHHNKAIPLLVNHAGQGLAGTFLGSHHNIRLCEDCAERCFLQDLWKGSRCQGFEFKPTSGGVGVCSYYKNITGVVLKEGIDAYTSSKQFHTCPHNSGIPALGKHIGHGLVGALLGAHHNIKLCEDCAERCFLQNLWKGSHCEGFEFKPTSRDAGVCSYFSNVTGVVMKKGINAYTISNQYHKCSHNPRIPTLGKHLGKGLVGTFLGSHHNIKLCEDCAERCFLQDLWQGSHCQGFEFKPTSGGNGICSYYSDIMDVAPNNGTDAYVVLHRSS